MPKGKSKPSKKTKEANPAKLTRAAAELPNANGDQEADQPLSPKQEAKKGLISSYYSVSPPPSSVNAVQRESDGSSDQSKGHSAHQTIHKAKTIKQTGKNSESCLQDVTDTSEKLSVDVASLDQGKEKAVTPDKRPTSSKHLMSPSQKESQKEKKKQKKRSESQKNQTFLGEFFQRRRSNRKNKTELEEEKRKKLEEAILLEKEEGIEVRDVEGKGRGVFSTKLFEKGDFICEYAGELVDYSTAKEREKLYEGEPVGCYMYYFTFKNKKYCVDATKETGRLGRLLNHSKGGNCMTKVVSVKENPYLILLAAKTIKAGEELLYDYGERSKDILESHPWLKS